MNDLDKLKQDLNEALDTVLVLLREFNQRLSQLEIAVLAEKQAKSNDVMPPEEFKSKIRKALLDEGEK